MLRTNHRSDPCLTGRGTQDQITLFQDQTPLHIEKIGERALHSMTLDGNATMKIQCLLWQFLALTGSYAHTAPCVLDGHLCGALRFVLHILETLCTAKPFRSQLTALTIYSSKCGWTSHKLLAMGTLLVR